MKTSDKLVIVDYISGLKNEIYFDEETIKHSGCSVLSDIYMPRASYWLSVGRKYPVAVKYLSRLSLVLWVHGVSTLYFLCNFIYFILIKNFKQYKNITMGLDEGAVIIASKKTSELLCNKIYEELPKIWVVLPWVDVAQPPKNIRTIFLLELLKNRDLLRVFCLSIASVNIVKSRDNLRNWSLQTYTAFRWFAVRLAIDKMGGELVITSHYDRWAVLIDRAVSASSSCTDSRLQKKLTMVQHGSLGDIGRNSSSNNKGVPTRIKNVRHLFAYDENEVGEFFRKVLKNEALTICCINFFEPQISLIGQLQAGVISVLVVSHPLCESFQINILKELSKTEDLFVYFKPHPRARTSVENADINILKYHRIMSKNDQFPLVDFVISYPSTLVKEYGSHGINAVVHSIDSSRNEMPAVIDEVMHLIKKLKINKHI